jgi:hypothetical protein
MKKRAWRSEASGPRTAGLPFGNENPASLQRRTILDEDIISESGLSSRPTQDWQRRACYLYSKTDRMCLWSDVSEHAQDARLQGWQVQEIVFDDSKHCAHMSMDPARYVKVLENMWQGSNSERRVREVAKS